MRYVIEIKEADDEWQVKPVKHPESSVKLPKMQEVVGGLVDKVSIQVPGIDNEVDVWVHDEGLLIGKPLNLGATILAGQPLVGDALVTIHDGYGVSRSLTFEEVNAVINHMKSRSNPHD